MSHKPDRVELWVGDRILIGLNSSFAPIDGDLINIKKRTYLVTGRSFAIDFADDMHERQMRCNVIVEPVEP